MLLRSAVGMAAPQATAPALGAAELVGAALEAFATDSDLLAGQRSRHTLFLAADAAQSVSSSRGADPSLLRGDAPAVTLTRSLRCAPAIADAITTVARRL